MKPKVAFLIVDPYKKYIKCYVCNLPQCVHKFVKECHMAYLGQEAASTKHS